jgi:hypothetical protein
MNYGSFTSTHSSFMRLCASKKFFVYKQNTGAQSKYTHLSMDGHKGGLISIPPNLEWMMLKQYGIDLESKMHFYLTESRTDYFRFFVDFDVSTGSMEITPEGRLIILKLIYLTVRLFYPKDTDNSVFTMMILDNSAFIKEARKKADVDTLEPVVMLDLRNKTEKLNPSQETIPLQDSKQDPSLVSNNMHIVFPYLVVNQEQAFSMGQAITCKFTTEVGNIGLGKTWRDIIDNSVYLSNGLRMPGSRKCAKCPHCKGKRCEKCHDMGKVDLGRVYDLVSVFTGEKYDKGMLSRLRGNMCQMLLHCTIRQPEATASTPGWKKWAGCPSLDPAILDRIKLHRDSILDDNLSVNKRFEKLTNAKVNLESSEDKIGQRKQRAVCITLVESSPFYKAALDEIQRFHADYKRTEIRSLMTTVKKTYFRACTIGEGSSVCMNLVKREHNNNSIYFIIKPCGVYQKCWCNCDTTEGRKHGQCRKFISRGNILLAHNLAILFPNHRPSNAPMFNAPFSCIGNSTNSCTEERILSSLYMTAFGGIKSVESHTRRPKKTNGATKKRKKYNA